MPIKAGWLDAPFALRDFSRSNKQKEIQNSLLRNINDNGDNNEKTKSLKTWVEIFWARIFRGEFSRGEFDGWEFSGC